MWPLRPNDRVKSRADAGRTSRYLVAKSEDGWDVIYDEAPINRFGDSRSAVAFACGLACAEAELGAIATVVVDGPVNEIHRYALRPAESGDRSKFP